MPALVKICDLHLETLKERPDVLPAVKDFLKVKSADVTARYGAKDTHFIADGPIGLTGLKLKHAHISQDLSIVYRVHGNPAVIELYGVFSHKDLGTGNTPNIKTQKRMATKFLNQTFKE